MRVKAEYDAVVKEEEARVREAGGLHVIGTERHESRRVDNQLRGRAGRRVILALHAFSVLGRQPATDLRGRPRRKPDECLPR